MTEQDEDEMLAIREAALKHSAICYAKWSNPINESILLGEAREFSEFCSKIPRFKDYMKTVWVESCCEND